MLQLKALKLALDLLQALQLSDHLRLRGGGFAPNEPVPYLLAPARKHERVDAQRVCNILDEHARLIAQGHRLELEVIGVPIDEFAARFSHRGTFSVRLECPQKSDKLRVHVELTVRHYFLEMHFPNSSRGNPRRSKMLVDCSGIVVTIRLAGIRLGP